METLAGTSAIVTGGGSGLGAATARALARAGAAVAVVDVDGARAESVAAEIAGRAVRCAATDEAQVEAAVVAAGELGELRTLVSCHGILHAERIVGREGPAALEPFARVIAVNLVGTFNVLRVAAAAMARNDPDAGGERGVAVLTASIAAYEGQIGQAAYAASKGGVVALTLAAARDLARNGIRVCSIAPGIMDTPMAAGLPDEAREALEAQVPFPPRFGRPDEFAALVLHVLANPLLNGETIRLDGALRMQPR